VHLYGGLHGEMTHYELLAKRAEQDGLIVPRTPAVSKDKSMEALIKLLLSSGSFSLQPTQHDFSNSDAEERTMKREEKIEQRSIAELADQFDYWMRHYTEGHKRDGHYEDNNKALIDWLMADYGYKYINNYSHFCELAIAVHKKGYATNPPPSESVFDKFMEKCVEMEKPQSKYKGTVFQPSEKKAEEKSLTELANRFDYWMKNYTHPQQEDGRRLIAWLSEKSGGEHVQTYDKFCKLAAELNKKGYKTTPPPVESEFNKGIEEFNKQEQQLRKFF